MTDRIFAKAIRDVGHALATHGGRMGRIEQMAELAGRRLAFWQAVGVAGLGLAALFAWAWWQAEQRKAQ